MKCTLSTDRTPFSPAKASSFVLACLLAICALFTRVQIVTASTSDVADARITILESTSHHIIVEVVVDDFQIETLTIEGEPFQRIKITGYDYNEISGAPQLPIVGAMLGVPTAENLSVHLLDADFINHSGLRLAPVPHYSATALDLDDFDLDNLQPAYLPDPTIYAQDAWYPQQPIQLGMVGSLRDQPIAQLQLSPVQYNPLRAEARIYRRLVVQVTWPALAATAQNNHRAVSLAYERVLARTLLNYDQLARTQTSAPTSPTLAASTVAATVASTQTLKIYVNKDGVYQVTHNDLASNGLAPDTIDPRNLKLTNQGVEIPIFVNGQNDGVFDPGDTILFYGKAITDVYTTQNVYWLSAGNSAGLRMTQRNGTPGGTDPVPSRFRTLLHAEEDLTWWRIMPQGAGKDHWFWFDRISPNTGGLPVSRAYTLKLDHIDTQPGTATIRVQLRGYTSLQHRSKIFLNDTEIDDQSWEGQIVFNHAVDIDHALLQQGDNVIRIESIDTGASVDQYFINWIEIEYWDTYTADSDQLSFRAPAAGPFNFEIAGFSGSDLLAFDITNSAAPQMIANAVTTPSGGSTTLKFRDAASAATRYLVLHSSQIKTPLSIVLDQPSLWKQPTNGADYILITHEDFYANALPLAQHRSNSGLRVAVVKVGDLYDEFNGGVFNPQAIRDFLSYAYQNWQAPAPTFVVLVGDANADYQDFRKTGTVNYVPTQIIDTEMFQALSDTWFAAVSGDDILPDLFIGRLSAQHPTQVDDLVAKVIAYDKVPSTNNWNKEVLLIADDQEIIFADLSEELANRLPHYYTANRVYVGDYPPGDPTTAIANYFANGVSLITYTGHGEYFRWGKWNKERDFIWGLPEIESLQNADRLPIITVANCLNGYFADRKNDISVAEAFLRSPTGGAIAVLAPSSFGFPSTQRVFMNAFYDAIFQEDNFALGAAMTTAMVNGLAQNIFLDEIVKTFILFADPATQANLPTNYPYLQSTTPANGATNVAPDQSLQVTFSKPVSITSVALSGSGTAGRVFTPTWNTTQTIVTLAHNGFAHGQNYQFTISAQDLAGVALGTGTVPSTWSFTTSDDATPPTLTIDDPSFSDSSLSIVLRFSEAMRQQSVVTSLEPEAAEPIFLAWNDDAQIATATVSLAASAQLQPGQLYTLRVITGKDLAGNVLAAPVEKSFTITRKLFLPNASK